MKIMKLLWKLWKLFSNAVGSSQKDHPNIVFIPILHTVFASIGSIILKRGTQRNKWHAMAAIIHGNASRSSKFYRGGTRVPWSEKR